jgi:hypothetical protein
MQSQDIKLLRVTLTASLMLAAMAGSVVAGPLEDAIAASQKGGYATALRLFRSLAEQSNAAAQSALGFMYETAEGAVQDYSAAGRWYRLAGEQGDALAQTRLGFMYEMGKGMAQDFAEAAKWLRLAAEQGRVAAQDELGRMYSSGRGVSKDYVVAYMWLDLSASQGDHDAAIQRDLVAKLMTPAEIAEAQKLAREWKPKR